jgi:hypothetical protein
MLCRVNNYIVTDAAKVHIANFVDCLALKMKALFFFEMSLTLKELTRCMYQARRFSSTYHRSEDFQSRKC